MNEPVEQVQVIEPQPVVVEDDVTERFVSFEKKYFFDVKIIDRILFARMQILNLIYIQSATVKL